MCANYEYNENARQRLHKTIDPCAAEDPETGQRRRQRALTRCDDVDDSSKASAMKTIFTRLEIISHRIRTANLYIVVYVFYMLPTAGA